MEDKLPPKETHVLTLSDFIERRKEWDQEDESRLAEYLQQLSNKITQGAKNTLNELDDLVASIDDTAVQIANINNEFQLLADKQFIENKVQDEDETVQTKVEKPVLRETNDADTLINNIKEALKNSFKAIDTHFEKITVVVSDSDDNDDELRNEETILRPKIFYKKLNLPSLSGNTLSEIVVDNAMFSDSDSDVEQPTNTFKDQESLSSNDVPEEDVYSISESKNTYEPNSELIGANNIYFESEKPKSKNIPTYVDDGKDDLFTPPPLINDDEDENLENEYNIFGNGSSNMFGEKNLWDDIDDDDNDDFSNEPPLPIYSDKPPLQEPKSYTQVKVEAPSIQQTLNDELRKRFQKDSTSSQSDNLNAISSKTKLPKGAVNILGGTDIKPYISSPASNIKPSIIPEISKKMAITQNDTTEDFNTSNKVVDDFNSNSVTIAHKELIKETKPLKKRSLFDQESDDDDLFTKKTVTVSSTLKSNILESKESLTKDKILSRNLFSESDSDEDFMDSKLKTKANSTIDNNSTKLLDSSSDDDLFSNKSINKIIPKQISVVSSSPIHVEDVKVLNKSNEIKHLSKLPIEKDKVKDTLNKEITDKLKKDSINPSVADNKVTEEEFLPNDNTLNSNTIESLNNNNIMIQSNQKPSNSQQAKKLSNFFSSDEDDLDEDTLFNVNKPNKNSIKKDQLISNASEIGQITNPEVRGLKKDLFDSSSDDDLFVTNKPNYSHTFSKHRKQSSFNEIGNKEIDDCAITNKATNIDKISQMGNDIDKNNTKNFSLLSDDEDENYLSFDKNISDAFISLSNNQNINENISTISLSSEEFLSPKMDQNNQDMFQNTAPDSLQDSKNRDLFSQKEIHMPKNEIMSNENTIHSNKISTLSSNDEQKLILSSQIQNENSNKETKMISPTSNFSTGNLLNNKNQEPLKKKDLNASNIMTVSISSENTIQSIENPIFISSDEQQFNSNTQNVNTNQEIDVICPTSDLSLKDSIDGSSLSLPNSRNETLKKLPGKLNKNAGAFINVASLLPNSKSPLKISDIPRSVSLDEKNDTLPTDGTKLFSAEKERARIQVKRRPQSRKARIAAARMSSIDIGSATNFEESSRLFVSTSNLDDYQSSPILNNECTDVDSSNEVKNKIVENDEKIESKNKLTKNLFDDDLDQSKSIQQEFDKKDSNYNKNIILSEELLESNKSVQEQLPVIESNHKKLLENEPVKEKQLETELIKKKQPEIDSINEKVSEIERTHETQVKVFSMKELEENKSKSMISNTLLLQKSNSLFDDDDDDDDDLFSRKSGKVNKTISNIFDSDDEFEFNQKFTKKNSDKTKSIFGDDSDDDLFNTPKKPSGSNLTSQKSIDKLNQRQNRSSGDGYVKLAAESVAVNPLESKKN